VLLWAAGTRAPAPPGGVIQDPGRPKESLLLSPKEAPPPRPRFVPKNDRALKASIFTWFDLLDRLVEHHSTTNPTTGNPDQPFRYGYIREGMQLDTYIAAAQEPHVQRYCEVGVNGGHGTVAMLLANPRMTVVSFDLGEWPYSRHVYDLISIAFPNQVRFMVGDSKQTLPAFASRVRNGSEPTCDLVLVDGEHTEQGVLRDVRNLRSMIAPGAKGGAVKVLIDDVNFARPRAGLQKVVEQGLIVVDQDRIFHGAGPNNPCMRVAGKRECYGAEPNSTIAKQTHLPAWGLSEGCLVCEPRWGFATGHFVPVTRAGGGNGGGGNGLFSKWK